MKISKIFFLFLFVSNLLAKDFSGPQFNVSAANIQNEKIKCKFLCCSKNKNIIKLCKIINYDLEFTDQFQSDLQIYFGPIVSKLWATLFSQDYSLLLFAEELKNEKFNVRIVLKDTNEGKDLYNKKLKIDKKNIITKSHEISDEFYQKMTGQNSPFLNKLAYCSAISSRKKIIYLSDYSCKKHKNIVPFNTIQVAPVFGLNNHLFYSQFTKKNNRLMSVDLKTGKHRIVCSYKGHNMQPSFSKDGKKIVLCLSATGNSELYLYDQNLCKKSGKKVFKKLTNNKGNNVSPTLLPNGNLVFCSDYQTGLPQIYYMDMKNKKTFRLTNGKGYCAAPSFCEKNNSIAYTRVIDGNFQLFTINLNDKKQMVEKQLTFDIADKHEPSWHESGNYMVFSYSKKNDPKLRIPQIAILNMVSGKIRIMTSGVAKSYPVWQVASN